MDRNEAKRLLERCLPSLKLSSDASDETAYQLEELLSPSSSISSSKIAVDSLCRLWGGMGYVYNVSIGDIEIIVKRVSPLPKHQKRISQGDKRKADSYQVEANFYEHLAMYLLEEKALDIPRRYHVERDDGVIICMSKLTGHVRSIDQEETFAVLKWLATLHAATWGDMATTAVEKYGLQPVGSYWHLDTRPDEHMSMRNSGWNGRLKRAARAIDERLKRDKMQCCVHGDAKDANMLFHHDREKNNLRVSMYDFQYCGKSPPTKDLAYFLCVAAHDNDRKYVEYYHEQLLKCLGPNDYRPTWKELDDSLQLAYCDWARFMAGWGFWGSDISDHVIAVLDRLDGGTDLGSEDAYREAVRQEFG
jgi:aminoglycoside phosphotransferase (APT) family kinase protein